MVKKDSAICRIGTSGYHYDHWQPIFYPVGLPKRKWFDFYAENFDTVEINNTFYRLPKSETFDLWRERSKKGFIYALKFSRYGTHMKKLKSPSEIIKTFLSRAERLKSFLGPILVQLPPHWSADPKRLEGFLREAPSRHRWSIEFRDPDWLCEEVYNVLHSYNAALCIHDMLKDHPKLITSDWTYLRFHGNGYSGSYSRESLSTWARWIDDRMTDGIDVYVYFNNDAEGNAVNDALALKRDLFGK